MRKPPLEPTRRGRGLTAKEAAEYCGVAIATLAKWRQRGWGPSYSCALGRDPRYHAEDLDAFLWGGGLVGNSVEAAQQRKERKAGGNGGR